MIINLYSSPKRDLDEDDSPIVRLITSWERLSLALSSICSEKSFAITNASVVLPIPGGPTKSSGF